MRSPPSSTPSFAPAEPPPQVLCVSGLDPGGGAGLQADIEAIAALGGHALGLVSALTVQDSRDVRYSRPVDTELLQVQLDCLLADCRPRAIKLGLLGSPAQAATLAAALGRLGLPAVCDPVLRAGGGHDFDRGDFIPALRREVFPWITVLTPNAAEARRLAPEAATLADCARVLLEQGCNHVLITGGDEPGESVLNTWHRPGAAPVAFRWPRLPETFHGAGCTLAAAIAARLAAGDEVGVALETAQAWTQAALAQAFAIGGGRRIPRRSAGLHAAPAVPAPTPAR